MEGSKCFGKLRPASFRRGGLCLIEIGFPGAGEELSSESQLQVISLERHPAP